jgi:hypothetical protein
MMVMPVVVVVMVVAMSDIDDHLSVRRGDERAYQHEGEQEESEKLRT